MNESTKPPILRRSLISSPWQLGLGYFVSVTTIVVVILFFLMSIVATEVLKATTEYNGTGGSGEYLFGIQLIALFFIFPLLLVSAITGFIFLAYQLKHLGATLIPMYKKIIVYGFNGLLVLGFLAYILMFLGALVISVLRVIG